MSGRLRARLLLNLISQNFFLFASHARGESLEFSKVSPHFNLLFHFFVNLILPNYISYAVKKCLICAGNEQLNLVRHAISSAVFNFTGYLDNSSFFANHVNNYTC